MMHSFRAFVTYPEFQFLRGFFWESSINPKPIISRVMIIGKANELFFSLKNDKRIIFTYKFNL